VKKPDAVIDASCVIALDALNLLPKLTWLFDRLLLPKAVRVELNRRRRTKDRLAVLRREYAPFLVPCDKYDQGAVDTLVIERVRFGKKDRGEAEAVVQAAAEGAIVIIDDKGGRKLAERYSLSYHGILWVLERLQLLGLITPSILRQHLEQLKHIQSRFPIKAANELLQSLDQPPL
jgi:predicted nucleic acid-binding protein